MTREPTKSFEEKLIPFNYERIYSCSKGALRVLILIFFAFEIFLIYACIHDYNSGLESVERYGSHSYQLFLIPDQNFYFNAETPVQVFQAMFSIFFTVTIVAYYSYWTLIRLGIWIIDGFYENK